MPNDKENILNSIRALGTKVLPSDARLILFGSQARGEGRAESDWDLLILLDEDKQQTSDFVKYAYPFTLMASAEDQMVIPQIYTKRQWQQMQFTPFVKNVEHDKVVLV